jgi:CheY-like chemotaxis protein
MSKRILVVDDQQGNRRIRDMLAATGYAIAEAERDLGHI